MIVIVAAQPALALMVCSDTESSVSFSMNLCVSLNVVYSSVFVVMKQQTVGGLVKGQGLPSRLLLLLVSLFLSPPPLPVLLFTQDITLTLSDSLSLFGQLPILPL